MNNDILSQATQAAQRGERLSRERALHDKELEQILDELDLEFAEEMEKEVEPVSEEEVRKMHAKVKHLTRQYFEER